MRTHDGLWLSLACTPQAPSMRNTMQSVMRDAIDGSAITREHAQRLPMSCHAAGMEKCVSNGEPTHAAAEQSMSEHPAAMCQPCATIDARRRRYCQVICAVPCFTVLARSFCESCHRSSRVTQLLLPALAGLHYAHCCAPINACWQSSQRSLSRSSNRGRCRTKWTSDAR